MSFSFLTFGLIVNHAIFLETVVLLLPSPDFLLKSQFADIFHLIYDTLDYGL